MSIVSTEGSFSAYKYLDVESINHPSVDDTRHDFVYLQTEPSGRTRSTRLKPTWIEQEPVEHNPTQQEKEQALLIKAVEERCGLLKQEFEMRMERLEKQYMDIEKEFAKIKSDIEKIYALQKRYIDKEVQTDANHPE
ncbi:hypothetical protein G6F47_007742 [Rhizopus delemar]|nr:hypothetical protein G6F54_010370 [Rhizopus delemar]KAG1504278.1 hypothetical protein G6F53_010435 [Rhizopus delemar]KAG1596946.1 hypothetical protein G6F47_007742 [Rhizopus delemar]